MLLVVRQNELRLAVINTDHLIDAFWADETDKHDQWVLQMTHGRTIPILIDKMPGAQPSIPGRELTPKDLISAMAGLAVR